MICSQTHEYSASATINILYLLYDQGFYVNFTNWTYPNAYFLHPRAPPVCANYVNNSESLDDQQAWASKLCKKANNMYKATKKQTALYIPYHILEQWNQLSIMSSNTRIPNFKPVSDKIWQHDGRGTQQIEAQLSQRAGCGFRHQQPDYVHNRITNVLFNTRVHFK